ncbi:hypothetical protein Tco_0269044 [Tanacetum coccineum]
MAAASLTKFELKKIILNKDLFESYGKAYSLKRDREDKDKDEDPPAGSGQGLKRRKTRKDVEPSKDLKTSSSKSTKSQPKSSGKSAQAKESVFETVDTDMPQNQGSDLGNTDDQPNVEAASEQCYKVVTDQLDWNNPEGQEYLFDLSKPLPLIEDRGRQVVPVNYFLNNDLEYLKGGSSSRKYTTSTTKTKAAKYDDIQGIEDMVPSLWSPVNHDVFSTERIIVVTYVKVMKWYDYGYLEEIVVQREDQKLYKFKEGDFPRLNLRNIEHMLLLLVQNKIANLEKDVILDLNVALRMFARHVVILKRVEDLQLGVESYQKKLNITRPNTFRSNISKRTPYTAYNNPQGIIYVDKFKRNRLMSSDELYKFSDGTLKSFDMFFMILLPT